MEPVSIALASDRNFICGLLVTVHSICRHAAEGSSLKFHVLDLGLEEQDQLLVRNMGETTTRCQTSFIFHKASIADYRHLPSWRGNYATYARLVLQDMLPDEDWIIYTDIDTLWLRDIGELWAMRDSSHALAAVPDGSGFMEFSGAQRAANDCAAHGRIIDPGKYFCAGLLLMNLKRLRETGFTEKCADFLKNRKDLLWAPDQNLYNYIYPAPETFLLDPLWGEFAQAYGRRGTRAPRVIHYAYSAPWVKNRMTPPQLLWWRYLHDQIGLDKLGHHRAALEKECRRSLRRISNLSSTCRFLATYGATALFKPKLWRKRCAERKLVIQKD